MHHPTNRAERRAAAARARARARRQILEYPSDWPRDDDPRAVGIQAQSPRRCSCPMCSPAKWFPGRRHSDSRRSPAPYAIERAS